MIPAVRGKIFWTLFLGGISALQALRFTQSPPARISKSLGDNVMLRWTYSITKPSELVRLECGYLNQSRQMLKLMEQFSTESQPRTTVAGTRFANRAYIQNGALMLTNLRAEDSGIYYCIIKAYNAARFQTITLRSTDSYMTVGALKSQGRSGMESGTRTTIIVIIVIVIVLVIAFFVFFFWRKRGRSKGNRIPLSYEEDGNEKKRSINGAKNGRMETSRHSERRGLTAADIEIVSSPMEAISKQNSETSYSSHKAYVAVDVDNDDAGQKRESWPEPPLQTNANQTGEKPRPPGRAPPRVLPKTPRQNTVNDKTFI